MGRHLVTEVPITPGGIFPGGITHTVKAPHTQSLLLLVLRESAPTWVQGERTVGQTSGGMTRPPEAGRDLSPMMLLIQYDQNSGQSILRTLKGPVKM